MTVLIPPPLPPSEFDALEGMAKVLTASGWYRVTRLFQPRARYRAEDSSEKKRRALFVDVETTGLDHGEHRIIEFAAVPFEYGVTTGEVYEVGEGVSFFDDPEHPIPEHVTNLTGITDDMVRGQRIDEDRVGALLSDAALVIAHNAKFDRPFVERRLPDFSAKAWACSHAEVPWQQHGCTGTKLEYLLYSHCAEFFAGHRALEDCRVGVHVLATRLKTGALPMELLLASAREPTVRVWATGATFERKDALKSRGYAWHQGQPGGARTKVWYRDVPANAAVCERAWLADHVYAGRPPAYECDVLTATTRYAARS
jgi:DNA polymerase III subunit epsilon